jgi:hypothetical protein
MRRLYSPCKSANHVLIEDSAIRILCNRFLSNSLNIRKLDRDSISSDPETARRALLLYKLLVRYAPEHRALDTLNGTVEDQFSTRVAHVGGPGYYNPPRPREREESHEEQALRRRRREAIVLNEGDRPLSQDDIIQRSGSSTVMRPRDEVETRRVERALEEISTAGYAV